MTPATGATGKPLSFLFKNAPPTEHFADPGTCPHATKTFKAGVWSCRRCGVAL